MSKRTSIKLALHRETVRTLRSVDLDGVHGGANTQACTVTIETRQCAVDRLNDHGNVNHTVYPPGGDPPAQNDTMYRGGGGRIIPV
jgi:hypothetical protein